jgi:BirA family biotin operon repressor/biotin-[acetyl-CoA-carboxylase] ligase
MQQPPPLPLPIDDLRRACAGRRFGRSIEYLATTESTNTLAHERARAGADEGTVVIAETQTAGRGRLGRSWLSPPYRNLYLSIVLRPPLPPAAAPRIALVAGLATAETVAEWAPRAAVKWPNDVVVDGRKLAGILTEMDADADQVRFVIAGIGVNLNIGTDEFPPDLRDIAVGLCALTDAPIDRAAFAARLLAQLETRYYQFLRDGFPAVRPLWAARSCLDGRQITIDDGQRRCVGTCAGLADDGTLRVVDVAGTEHRIVAGDVTVIGGYGRG